MQTEEKNNEKRRLNQKKKLSKKCFNWFKYVIDLVNFNYSSIPFLPLASWDIFCTSFCNFSAQIVLQVSKFIAIELFSFFEYKFLKTHPPRRVFHNAKARECIFRASVGKNLEKFSPWHQTWCCLCGFGVCTSLPKTTLDMSLHLMTFHC